MTVTTIVTDQKIIETMPKTLSVLAVTGCGSLGLKTVWTVYSGLVPMSPNTTPRAPRMRAPLAVPGALCVFAFVRTGSPIRLRRTTVHTAPASASLPEAAGGLFRSPAR